MHHPTDRITHATVFVTPVVEHWLEYVQYKCITISFRLAAKVLLYAPSHRQDSTYHNLCYTSRGALAGTCPVQMYNHFRYRTLCEVHQQYLFQGCLPDNVNSTVLAVDEKAKTTTIIQQAIYGCLFDPFCRSMYYIQTNRI